jgi:hypothetical protein
VLTTIEGAAETGSGNALAVVNLGDALADRGLVVGIEGKGRTLVVLNERESRPFGESCPCPDRAPDDATSCYSHAVDPSRPSSGWGADV